MIQKLLNKLKDTNKLRNLIRSNKENELSNYSIVYILQNEDDSKDIKKVKINEHDIEIFGAYTRKDPTLECDNYKFVPIMLGNLSKKIQSHSHIEVIGINYLLDQKSFEEMVFVPVADKLTKQNLISPTDESLALLSIDHNSHLNMGVEATFFSINNKFLNDDPEERAQSLEQIVEDISFIIPRITQPKGSANIITLLLNLENAVEEKAFIRMYKSFDPYIEVLFVTSELKLLTGDLEEIHYNGANLEGVYSPIIQRQISKSVPR